MARSFTHTHLQLTSLIMIIYASLSLAGQAQAGLGYNPSLTSTRALFIDFQMNLIRAVIQQDIRKREGPH